MILFVFCALAGADGTGPKLFSIDQWRADLAATREALERMHPNPYYRQPKDEFDRRYDELYNDIPRLDDQQIVVRIMQLVASIGDGHTGVQVSANAKLGFTTIYPARMYRFADGLFIVSARPELGDIVGAQVLAIGPLSVEEAFARAETVFGWDNEFTRTGNAPIALLQPPIVRALGLAEADGSMKLSVRDRNGATREVVLPAGPEGSYPRGNRSWAVGANFGLPSGAATVMNAATTIPPPLAWSKLDEPFWFEHLPHHRTVYFQFNEVSGRNPKTGESFANFCEKMFRFIEINEVKRLIVDIRWNGGGNNMLLRPLLHGIIRSDEVNRWGGLWVITGRDTFSAAMSCLGQLEYHTKAVIVGEPSGSLPNQYGDNRPFTLPNSGIVLRISSVWWMNTHALDRRVFIGPHVPVELTSVDFAANRDPVVERILEMPDYQPLTDVLKTAYAKGGIEGAVDAYRSFKRMNPDRWTTTEAEINRIGYEMLQGGKLPEAVALFTLNTESYPLSSNVWDSLGEGLAAQGKKAEAIAAYRKSLELNPGNDNARQWITKLESPGH